MHRRRYVCYASPSIVGAGGTESFPLSCRQALSGLVPWSGAESLGQAPSDRRDWVLRRAKRRPTRRHRAATNRALRATSMYPSNSAFAPPPAQARFRLRPAWWMPSNGRLARGGCCGRKQESGRFGSGHDRRRYLSGSFPSDPGPRHPLLLRCWLARRRDRWLEQPEIIDCLYCRLDPRFAPRS